MHTLHLFRVFNEDGSVNRMTACIAIVAVSLFVGIRLMGAGTHDSEYLLGQIETEMTRDHRHTLVAQLTAAREAGDDEKALEVSKPLAVEGAIRVEFEDVAFAAPLLSWGVAENVGVRFRYKLFVLDEPVEEGQRYLSITRAGLGSVRWIRDSDAFGYFLHFI